jgi:hypothetical protein
MLPSVDKPGWTETVNPLNTQGGCDPFVRITMDGSPKVESQRLSNMQRIVVWQDGVAVKTKAGCRRAKIELLDDSTAFMGMGHSETLIGEHTLYNLAAGSIHWIHFFGGAIQPQFPDEARAMSKGEKMPSTYRGSLCVLQNL